MFLLPQQHEGCWFRLSGSLCFCPCSFAIRLEGYISVFYMLYPSSFLCNAICDAETLLVSPRPGFTSADKVVFLNGTERAHPPPVSVTTAALPSPAGAADSVLVQQALLAQYSAYAGRGADPMAAWYAQHYGRQIAGQGPASQVSFSAVLGVRLRDGVRHRFTELAGKRA